MPRILQTDATEIIQPVLPRDAAGQPLGPIAYNDPDLSVQWRSSASESWQSITLAPGTVGVWSPGGWVHIGDGVHLLGIPAAAIVPGDSTLLRVAYGAAPPQFDSIDAVVPPMIDASGLRAAIGLSNADLGDQLEGIFDAVDRTETAVDRTETKVNGIITSLEEIANAVPGDDAQPLMFICESDGQPIAGVVVRIAGRRLTTGSDGLTPEIIVDPGEYTAKYWPPPGFGFLLDDEITVGSAPVTWPVELTSINPAFDPPSGGYCNLIDRVFESDGLTPLEGAAVTAVAMDHAYVTGRGAATNERTTVLTGSGGWFRMPLPQKSVSPIRYEIFVNYDGRRIYKEVAGYIPNQESCTIQDILYEPRE